MGDAALSRCAWCTLAKFLSWVKGAACSPVLPSHTAWRTLSHGRLTCHGTSSQGRRNDWHALHCMICMTTLTHSTSRVFHSQAWFAWRRAHNTHGGECIWSVDGTLQRPPRCKHTPLTRWQLGNSTNLSVHLRFWTQLLPSCSHALHRPSCCLYMFPDNTLCTSACLLLPGRVLPACPQVWRAP